MLGPATAFSAVDAGMKHDNRPKTMFENKLIREYEMRHLNTISDSLQVHQSILVTVVDNLELRLGAEETT